MCESAVPASDKGQPSCLDVSICSSIGLPALASDLGVFYG